MKVRYTGDYYKVYLRKGEVYDAVVEGGMYRIFDEDDGESYLYWADDFEVVVQSWQRQRPTSRRFGHVGPFSRRVAPKTSA